jgi:hypothetical protein
MQSSFKRNLLSKLVLLLCLWFIIIYRIDSVNKTETSWDVFGYYLYLPATFIYDDPMLNDRTWVENVNEKHHLTATIYQITETPDHQPMYFFLMGMSFLYLPFFLLGHGIAGIFGYPMDGFSEPYQYSLVFGGIVYTFIGLVFLRKLLLRLFSDKMVSLLILILLFTTNATHHLTTKNLETVNFLFFLMCWLIYATMRWHESFKRKHLVQIGIAISLMALIKPTEVIVVLVPLLWGVNSKQTLKNKWQIIKQYKIHFFQVLLICLLIGSPQIAYWYSKTGSFIFDSYQNPGIGLDLLSPHILPVLFSGLKGWFVYTPIMIFGVVGLFFLVPKSAPFRWAFLIYFILCFYIISSWTEWWYGAAFSLRPIIICYPILLIGLGYLLLRIQSSILKWSMAVGVLFFTFLNQFQLWQMNNYIYDPYRTTWAYYKAIFLKTEAPANSEELKLINRSFDGSINWSDPEKYHQVLATNGPLVKDTSSLEFLSTFEKPYGSVTQKDHVYLTVDLAYSSPDSLNSYGPFLTFCVKYKGETYGYQSVDMSNNKDVKNGVYHLKATFLSPIIRTDNDKLNFYIWNPSKQPLKIKKFTIKAFEKQSN